MPYTMTVSNEKIQGQDTVPAGIYEIKLLKFKPALSKKGSLNLNANFEVVNHPELTTRKLYDNLNEGGSFTWPDFTHCFGIPMETDGKDSWIPGIKEIDNLETWVYRGPLVGRVGKVEVGIDSYGAKVRRYFCAVPDCATKFPTIRHIQDLMKRSK